MLPLLVLMSIGIARRWSDYGISIHRCYVLALNIWFYGICLYLFVSKAKHPKWIIISPAVIFLVLSFQPIGMAKVTKNVLLKQLEPVLWNNDTKTTTLKDAQTTFDALDSLQQQTVSSKLSYLRNTYGVESLQAHFSDSLLYGDIYSIYANMATNKVANTSFYYTTKDKPGLLHIDNYQLFIKVACSEYNDDNDKTIIQSLSGTVFTIKIAGKPARTIKIPLEDAVAAIIQKHGTNGYSLDWQELTIENSEYKFCITYIDGTNTNEKLRIETVNGYLFLKE
jgi:hypothetical protein